MAGAGVSVLEARAGVVAVTGGFVVAAAAVWEFAQQVRDMFAGSGDMLTGGRVSLSASAVPPSSLLVLVGLAGWVVMTAGAVMLLVYAGRVRTHLNAAGTPIGTVGLWAAALGTVLLTGSPLPSLVVAGVSLHVMGSGRGTRLMQVASVGAVAQVAAMVLQKDDATLWLAGMLLGGLGGATPPLTAWPVLLTAGCTVAALVLMWSAAADTPTSRLVVEEVSASSAVPSRSVSRSVNFEPADSFAPAGGSAGVGYQLMGVAAAQPAAAAQAQPVATVPAVAPVAPVPAPAVQAIPADWYPDPSGQARSRYWDGAAWTAHTSNA
jgi:hypothetical protein